jgi:hypothetical protein
LVSAKDQTEPEEFSEMHAQVDFQIFKLSQAIHQGLHLVREKNQDNKIIFPEEIRQNFHSDLVFGRSD